MPQSRQLSEDDFQGWMSHPVTRAMRDWLRAGIKATGEDFVAGALTMNDQWQSGMKQAHAIGRCEMAQTILDLELSQLGTYDEE